MLSASELAEKLNLSRARISQFVSEGKLEGCYHGAGRDRRFDPEKVAGALGRVLDPGQMLGNGRATREALRRIAAQAQPDVDAEPDAPPPRQRDGQLPITDPDRYELARTQKVEEEARQLRRRNQEAEGTLVLAAEAGRQATRLLAQEVAEFESVLRDGARRVADELGVDFKRARALLVEVWRAHRQTRSDQLVQQAETAGMTDTERSEDF
jgi:hypothetical protein